MAKIINGKLVIRVGGGYMSVDEFIDQYGKIELLKIMKQEGDPMADEILKKGGGARHSTVGDKKLGVNALDDAKAAARKSLMGNINVYDN